MATHLKIVLLLLQGTILATSTFAQENSDEILLLVGGYRVDQPLSDVEGLDLTSQHSCNEMLTPLPLATDYALAMTDDQGRPVACGGPFIADPKACLVYDSELDLWVDGPEMNFERFDGAASLRLPDGRHWITGADPGFNLVS